MAINIHIHRYRTNIYIYNIYKNIYIYYIEMCITIKIYIIHMQICKEHTCTIHTHGITWAIKLLSLQFCSHLDVYHCQGIWELRFYLVFFYFFQRMSQSTIQNLILFPACFQDDFPDPKPYWVGRMSLLNLPRCHTPFWLLNLNPSPKRGVDWTCSTLLKNKTAEQIVVDR